VIFLILRGNGVATHYNLLANTRLLVIQFAAVWVETEVSSSILDSSEEEIDVESIIVKSEIESIFESLEGSSCFGSTSRCSNVMSKGLAIRGFSADTRLSVIQFAAVWVETVSSGCESDIRWGCRSRNESTTGFTVNTFGKVYTSDVGCEPSLGRPAVVVLIN
jgi:hypothetical protein